MTLVAHFNAFKALLATGVLAGKVHDGVRYSSGTPVRDNYAILKPATTPDRDEKRYLALGSVASRSTYRFDVRYVATTLSGVLLWQQAGQERLIPVGGARLVVAGRECDPIQLVDPVEEGAYSYDKVTDLFYVDESYEFVSREA